MSFNRVFRTITMHNIIAMTYADTPGIFETEQLPIRINVADIPGQTVIDDNNRDTVVKVIKDLDQDAFVDHLTINLSPL